MDSSHPTYQSLERAIVEWAQEQDDVRAIAVVGSRARAHHGPDNWSDLDLIVFTTDPERLATDRAWLQMFSELWLAVAGRTGRGDPEWDALYAGGLKADFVIVSAGDGRQPLARLLQSSPYHFVFALGFRALLDKNDPAGTAPLPSFAPIPPEKPHAAAFKDHIVRFLLGSSRAARFIARADVWRAKQICDHDLRQQLLTMLEWHALAMGTEAQSIWYDGRYLDDWADPAALRALPATFGAYDLPDLARALQATLALYLRLSSETAGAWGYVPAVTESQRIVDWIRETLGVSPRS